MLQLFLLAALLLLACSKKELSLSHSSYSSSRFQFFCFSLLAAPLQILFYILKPRVSLLLEIYRLAALLARSSSSSSLQQQAAASSPFFSQLFSLPVLLCSAPFQILCNKYYIPLYLLRLLASLFFSQLFSMSVLLHSI